MNRLVLIRKSDTQGPRHGGMRQYRHFELWLNRVLIDTFNDDCPSTDYSIGKYLDSIIQSRISIFERALCCEVERIDEPGSVRLIQEVVPC